ncbi:fimbrial protein [Pantoea sp. 1.19]|uniref:fimbrial protein n=1 Tax=Pantoea sp. 1.19 TaxID=1925589 RepID=UPI00352B0C72
MRRGALLLLTLIALPTHAFTCQAMGKSISTSGTVNVPIDLAPIVGANENLVVDLSKSIQCRNDYPSLYTDPVRVNTGSDFQGQLAAFSGSLTYYGSRYPFPLKSPTAWVNHTWSTFEPWQAVLYLTPVGSASGVVIKAGTTIAQLLLEKEDSRNGTKQFITWNLIANNDVVIPTGGCDVSSRNVTVNLPDYPGSKSVPLTVSCGRQQALAFTLTGTTADASQTVFSNVASAPVAGGVGVQILRNGAPVTAGMPVPLGQVGTSPVNLGLTATYGPTGGQITAGNVQSIIDVTFSYQ